jgi:hypothetical protein
LNADHSATAQADALAKLLAVETGYPARPGDENAVVDFSDMVARRLQWQWPGQELDLERVHREVKEVLNDLGGDVWTSLARKRFWLRLLQRLRKRIGEFNPYYYDIPPEDIRRSVPAAVVPAGPPGADVIEVPPFILSRPWHVATPQETASKPLLIKAPSNAYRLPFWRAYFPNARVRILHLVRHPLGSLRGLVRGWRYHGYFYRKVDRSLRIDGYSDLFPSWGREWWKFDLPPGWERHASASLEEVCAFQWVSAHHAIEQGCDASDDLLRVRFEDLAGDSAGRAAEMRRISNWLGLSSTAATQLASRPLPRSTDTFPHPFDGEPRRDRVEQAARRYGLAELAARYGYLEAL